MAKVFVLGPSHWAAGPEEGVPTATPRDMRHRIAEILRSEGHAAFLMEDREDLPGEDLVDKFWRLATSEGVTDVVVYWPPGAKMATTHDELIILRARMKDLPPMPIWVFHHGRAAVIDRDHFTLLERGGRSRYMDAVARLGVRPFSWERPEQLLDGIRLLAMELG